MDLREASVYIPREGYDPPDPAWKERPMVKDIFDKERAQQSRD